MYDGLRENYTAQRSSYDKDRWGILFFDLHVSLPFVDAECIFLLSYVKRKLGGLARVGNDLC